MKTYIFGSKIGPGKKALLVCVAWIVLITVMHHWRSHTPVKDTALRVGFLPITCHLICPVTYSHLESEKSAFRAIKFGSWPEMIESLRGGELDMAFILAPIALALHAQGVHIKIVLLGHRDGTALVVKNDPSVSTMRDLSGGMVAIPIRFSMQNLALIRLCSQAGLPLSELDIVELPPPDMPSALAAGSIAAYIVGEPYAARSELAGTGKVLHHMKDAWPGFISSVLVVRDEVMRQRREEVSELLNTFCREAVWIEGHREEAAVLGARMYGLSASLLRYVLTSLPDRVSYAHILPNPEEFDRIGQAMLRAGLVEHVPKGEEIVDLTWLQQDTGNTDDEQKSKHKQ